MPLKKPTPKIFHRALQMRKEPTVAEAKLWDYLRRNQIDGVYFRRQHVIGKYIVDFCSLRRKLVIELDGSQHLGQEEHDQERTACLMTQGFSVLRFWNDKVMRDIEGVIKVIDLELQK
jgi:very-short-patch-repair endonuclease